MKSSTLFYHGEVDVSVCHGQRKLRTMHLHNSGSNLFFDTILHVICGQTSPNNIPKYLDIIVDDGEGTENSVKSCLIFKRQLAASRVQKLDEAIPCAYFSAVIPFSQFLQTDANPTYIGLYSKSDSGISDWLSKIDVVAGSPLDKEIEKYTTHQPGYEQYNLLVEWRMYISNPTSQAESKGV